MSREIRGKYEYEIYNKNGQWRYRIYDIDLNSGVIHTSIDHFDSAQWAKFAAIGQIELLRNKSKTHDNAITRIMPIIWRIIAKHHCTVNISTDDDFLTIMIIKDDKSKSYTSSDVNVILKHLERFLYGPRKLHEIKAKLIHYLASLRNRFVAA